MRIVHFVVVSLSFLGLTAACNNGSTVIPAGIPDMDASSDGLASDVSPPHEVGIDSEPELPGPLDLGFETEAPDPGTFLSPCSENADCVSGYCVETLDGYVCTQECSTECPPGWQCVNVGEAPDVLYVCLPLYGSLCRPCAGDAECGQGHSHLCVDHGGPVGSFCTGLCEQHECPEDFVCEEMTLGDETEAPVCMPETGECGCAPKYDGLTLVTPCYQSNEWGICFGERRCEAGILTDCDADVPAEDVCDGADNDCDGETDEGHLPSDCLLENEWGTCQGTLTCEAGEPVCQGTPAAEEDCNGLDDDCDGEVDEDFPDTDEDGLADCLDDDDDGDGVPDVADNCPKVANPDQENHDLDTLGDACDPDDDNDLTADEDDCAPLDPTVHPGAPELCNGVDDDCNGAIDDGFGDLDGDGIADCLDEDDDGDGVLDVDDNCPMDANANQVDTDGDGAGDVCDEDDDGDADPDVTDCAPLDPTKGHKNTEVCNGQDDDCDGEIDEIFPDLDGDGDADCVDDDDDGDGVNDMDDNCPVTPNPSQIDFDGDGTGDACEDDADGDGDPDATDCNPLDPEVHHGAVEVCNGKDDNCNSIADEGFPDTDGDGVADCLDDDDDGDGVPDVDDNCPLLANPGQADGDGDGAGDVCDDDDDGDGDPDATDCNPQDPAIHHGAVESCNGMDDDCDTLIDEEDSEGCTVYYYSGDGDGYGIELLSKCLCAASAPYMTTEFGDCDDNNAAIHPGANEWCNGKDDDCDGDLDEEGSLGCQDLYTDGDGDGVGAGDTTCLCGLPAGFSKQSGDCDDDDPDAYPGATEICDGKDNDCDGAADEEGALGCSGWYFDGDGDQYGVLGNSKCLCGAEGDYAAPVFGDCDDGDAAVHPGAPEVCNGKDDNCNGQVDEGVKTTFYKDVDGDGFGTPNDKLEACEAPEGYVSSGTDCNDFNPGLHPGAEELCNDVDDDCDGLIDDDLPLATVYVDLDGDGFGAENTQGQLHCLYDLDGDGEGETPPAGTSLVAGDCNDSSSVVFPGAPELCDGILNNCDMSVADYHCPQLCAGDWPVYVGVTSGYVIPAQTDATNHLEVLVQGAGKVRMLTSGGQVKWEATGGVQYSHPVMADMNMDGYLDAVLCQNNLVQVRSGVDGALLESYATPSTGWRMCAVFDVDNDGVADIIPGTSSKLSIVLRDGSGGAKQVFQISPPAGSYFSSDVPGVVDLDGDGIAEVVVGTGYSTCNSPTAPPCKGLLLAYDGATGQLKHDPEALFTLPEPGSAYAGGPAPFTADMDHDGENELMHWFGNHAIGGAAYVWELDGVPAEPTEPLNTSAPLLAPVDADGIPAGDGLLRHAGGAVADLDGDGVYEVITMSGGGLAVTRGGQLMDGYPVLNPGGTPVLADLDRNGQVEILYVGSDNASVNCYTLGEDTWNETRILHQGRPDAWSLGRYRTGALDPYEPNDIRSEEFQPEEATDPVTQARAFPLRGFRDKYSSSSGWSRAIKAILGTQGDRDYYWATGSHIYAVLEGLSGPTDFDLYVHMYYPAGGGYQYITTWQGEESGATDSVYCHWSTPCPDEVHTGTKLFLLEVRGKDEGVDHGPWPYKLRINWGAG